MRMKKVLSILLVAVMLISVMPFAAFAGAPSASDTGNPGSGIDINPVSPATVLPTVTATDSTAEGYDTAYEYTYANDGDAQYANYYGDITVSFDRAIEADDVVLAGAYDNFNGGAWNVVSLPSAGLAAGEEFRIVKDGLVGSAVTFSKLIAITGGDFRCAAKGVHVAGVTMTVKFNLYETKTSTEAIEIASGTKSYTFPEVNYVAEVNGTGYATLAEAIAAAGTGDTVTLLADVTVDSPVVVAAGKDIKFDLDGHSLSGNIADADGKKLIQVSGKLEFVGENGGCIYNTNVAGQGHAACQALTGGTVIVNAPIHFGDSDTDMTNANSVNRGCGIQNNGGTLIINDGYYTAIDANYSAGAWAYAILNCAGDTTVNNATVYGVGLHGALGCEEGTFTVNGGTFAVNGANNYYSLYCDGGDFTVNGGTFTNNGKYGVNYVGTGSSTTITGGDFTYSAKTPFVQSSSASNPVVSGGTFSAVVPEKCCAPGFEPVTEPNAQGKYTVVEDTSVAEIAGTKYDTLAAAIAAAKAGDTVKLLKNIELSETLAIAADKNIKLDLNGNDIFGAVNGNLIANFGTVEFVTGTGHIYNTDITAQSHDAVRNFGTLTVNAPVHFGDADDDMTNANTINRGGAIRNAGGTVVINDGYYTAIDNTKDANNKMTIYAYALINDNGGTMTVNDATVYGKNNGNIANNDGNVVINGGTLSLTKNVNTNYYNIYGGVGKAEINGGTFSTNTNYAFYTDASSTIDISGGDFTYNALKKAGTNDDNLNISGGTFSAVVPEEYCAPGFEPVTEPNAQGKYEVEVKTPNNGVSLTVGDDITSNYYVDYSAYAGATKVEYTYNAVNEYESKMAVTKTISLAAISAEMLDNGRIKITVSQAPAQMAEETEIKVMKGDEVLDTLNYSSKTYCDNIIAMDDDTLAEYAGSAEKAAQLKTLCNTIIAYGFAAQGVFTSYGTNPIASTAFSDAVQEQIAAASCAPGYSVNNAGQIRFKSIVFACTKDARLRFYLDVSGATSTPAAPIAENGRQANLKYVVNGGDKRYYVEVGDIDAVDFDEQIIVNYGGSRIACSVLDFCGLVLTSNTTEAMQEFAKTLIVYNTNAQAYFG